jgi:hypothetical protein
MFQRLRTRAGQSRTARTVEIYGWVLLAEGAAILFSPNRVSSLLHFALNLQASHVFQLVGVMIGGVGLLYTISGRVNAEGFVFATLIDRVLGPPLAAVLWYLGVIPGSFAFIFALADFVTWVWTLATWRAEQKRTQSL